MSRNTKALDEALRKKIGELGCTGVSVCIRGPEGIVFEKGYGKRSVQKDLPATPRTMYGIASLTKSFTALACSILQTRGQLDLDEPISRYVPSMRLPGVPDELLTLRQLGLHRGGIPFNECLDWCIACNTPGPYYMDDEYLRATAPSSMRTIEDIAAYLSEGHYPALGEPGEYMSYCNESYALLMAAFERASGEKLADFLEREIFRPLGMDRTVLDLDGSRANEIGGDDVTSFFSDWPDGKRESSQWPILPPYMGCACIKSTVEDLSLYYRMLANGGMHEGKRIVPAEAVEQMVGAQYPLRRKPFYAMGLRKRLVGGKMACDHGGELHGVSAFGGFLEGGYGVAILCNESEWDMEELQNACYAFLLGLPLDEDLMWTRPCGRDFSRPDTLWGDYVGHVGKPSHIRIFSRDGRLRADVGGTLCRLEYCEGTVFAAFGEASGKRVCFLRFVLKDGRAWAVKCGSLLYRRV